jgi:outer membrane protein assembly factor BamB
MPSPDSVNAFTSLAVGPTAVVAAGYGERADRRGLVSLMRVYDLLTGLVLWEEKIDDLIPRQVAINQNRVFMAGQLSPTEPDESLLVRAYDVRSGDFYWDFTRPLVRTRSIKLAAGRLFVAGDSGPVGSSNTYLGAFSTRTGAPLWENPAPMPGSFTVSRSKEAGSSAP